jgi:hypothetical protein
VPATALDRSYARRAWQRFEPVHACVYFSPECLEAAKAAGLKGFWMSYFGSRAAPMGPVAAGVVEATFFSFYPARVRRAVPDAWSYASPASLVESRRVAAATALRRNLGSAVEEQAPALLALMRPAVEAAVVAGRPLAGANREVPESGDPVADLWQATTFLREHRGDGHVSVLVAEGLDGCEALVLFAATNDVPAQMLKDARGWSDEDWGAAVDRLSGRGLAPGSEAARSLRERVEAATDELAVRPFAVLDDDQRDDLLARLDTLGHGDVPYPNPMGVPRPA